MAVTKRPRKTIGKRPPKKKPGKKGALVHFTATQKVSARTNPRAGDGGTDGGTVWVLIMPISWFKSNKKGVTKRTKTAVAQALKKFKKR
jgi:hypothetical protein